MKRICLFLTMMMMTMASLAGSNTHLYRGSSTYTSDILCTWDGRHLYRGNSTYTSDILYTWDGRHL